MVDGALTLFWKAEPVVGESSIEVGFSSGLRQSQCGLEQLESLVDIGRILFAQLKIDNSQVVEYSYIVRVGKFVAFEQCGCRSPAISSDVEVGLQQASTGERWRECQE